ncbi:MAG: hemolysin III family protein [Nanoarchaeota archaeon]
MTNNEPLSSLTHFIGFLLSIAGLVLLIVFASLSGTAWHIVAFSIFGTSLILLYLASTLYHFFPKESKAKRIFRKIDYSFIYILIAGTYTPVCLTVLRGGWGWSLFGIVWALAILGVILELINVEVKGWVSTIIYIFMGWIILIALLPLINSISGKGFLILFMGGVSYTAGAIFFALDKIVPRTRWFGMHEIFHFFVLVGSFLHFWFILKYLL